MYSYPSWRREFFQENSVKMHLHISAYSPTAQKLSQSLIFCLKNQATYKFRDLLDVTVYRDRIAITLDIFMNLVNTKP